MNIGEVYIAQSEDGPVKIGFSSHIETRMHLLSQATRRAVKLLARVPATRKTEFYLHQVFADVRLYGEWFHPSGRLLAMAEDIAERGLAALPAVAHPDPEYPIGEKTAHAEMLEVVRAMLVTIAGPRVPGERVPHQLRRVAKLTALSQRKAKSIWYRETVHVSAEEYLSIKDAHDAAIVSLMAQRAAGAISQGIADVYCAAPPLDARRIAAGRADRAVD